MCHIPKDEVLRYLGYKNQELSRELENRIDSLIETAKSVCSPKFTHMISDVEFNTDAIFLSGTSIQLTGNDIKKHLTGAKKCIILACTLGTAFETELMRIQAKSVTDSVIFDAVGNAYIESFADSCENKLLKPYRDGGYYSKYRYSPGYGDLPIELQNDILSALSAQKRIGLSVTDTNILIPRKSITAFIGIYDKPQSVLTSKCDACSSREFCKMKKEGFSCD